MLIQIVQLLKGPAVFEETVRINEGISLGATTYGTAGSST